MIRKTRRKLYWCMPNFEGSGCPNPLLDGAVEPMPRFLGPHFQQRGMMDFHLHAAERPT